ncbi:diphthamide biosynthesis methyltransferase [Ecytonucleospora hepatopenaei]|uniref:Diphthamide biosynthesis methyltransferase n=1 Tax=Ecytonucleospora hepatopenaei TaxID=646526 RepID=A0A1W0E2J8_9MICR|nr:diphthamide biosynthesis methyltransferase [Ecytonucleospora hepatopenaei]
MATEEMLQERMDEYRNSVSKPGKDGKPLYTGLPQMASDDQETVTTFSEGLEEIFVKEGELTVSEETHKHMQKDKIDTSPFQKKITDKGVVYSMPLEDAVIGVGSEGNRTGTTVTVGEEKFSIKDHPADLHVKEGEARMTPLDDLRKLFRPTIGKGAVPSDMEEEDPVESDLINKFAEQERARKKEQGTKIRVHKGKGGDAVVVKDTPYGTKEVKPMQTAQEEAASKLKTEEVHMETKPNGNPLDMDDMEHHEEDGTQSFMSWVETHMEHPKVEDKPFVIKDTHEETPDEEGVVEEQQVLRNEDGTVMTAEEAAAHRQAEKETMQTMVNGNTTGTSQEQTASGVSLTQTTSNAGMNTTTNTTTQTVTNNVVVETHHTSHPPQPAGKKEPKLNSHLPKGTPLNPTSPLTGQLNQDMNEKTGYTETVTETITNAMLPETTPANKVHNGMVKDAPAIAEQTGKSVQEVVETIDAIDKGLMEQLIDALKTHQPKHIVDQIVTEITTTIVEERITEGTNPTRQTDTTQWWIQ